MIVLAAGRGTRMKSSTPKVLFDVCGASSLEHVLRAVRSPGIAAAEVVVVIAPEPAVDPNDSHPPESLSAAAARHGAKTVVQDPPLGTGHAVKVGMSAVSEGERDVLIVYGDGPLFTATSLAALLALHRADGAAQTLLTATVSDPKGLGRIVRLPAKGGQLGSVARIVEELDADDATRTIREINTGIQVLRADVARAVLPALKNANIKGEYYLTDVTAMLIADGKKVSAVGVGDPREALTFNSIEELAGVRTEMRRRINAQHMAAGVDIIDPASAYIDVDVRIGRDTKILPGTVIGRGVSIGERCVIGPFAHLRLETRLDDGAEIGNFVEVKKSRIGAGSKAKHLTYIGDATLGKKVNVGCGTITANYDGKKKHETVIGDGAFIGSGTVLCAPVEIKQYAMTAAGAVVRPRTDVGESEVWAGVPARKLESSSQRRKSDRDNKKSGGKG